jgi:PAT family beta-lactamase induction signal transducer AmpG
MPFPNLLATRRGRLAAFFLLYVTEGIPSGFTGTAVATMMRRQGLEPAAIGTFIGLLYLPWAFKWAAGPVVDVLSADRWGRRRTWILLCQAMMAVMLLVAMNVPMAGQLAAFTAVLLVHNVFAATQDVAIDALAVDVLAEDERGLANGLMFAGQYVGIGLGGAGVLLLVPAIGIPATFLAVAGAILLVTLLVPWPMREPAGPPRSPGDGMGFIKVLGRMRRFVIDSVRAFVGTREARAAVLLALLPMGAYSLSLVLQSSLGVEFGLDDRQIVTLGLAGTVLSAVFCVVGGWLSDRFGRRRMLALFIVATVVPTLLLAVAMQRHGWIQPVDTTAAGRPAAPPSLVAAFVALALLNAVAQGLMYGAGTAIYMDVTTPAVAATQFTAYMALCNLVYAYTPMWQGRAIGAVGYPVTLLIDSAFGLVCLAVLPFLKRRKPAG